MYEHNCNDFLLIHNNHCLVNYIDYLKTVCCEAGNMDKHKDVRDSDEG